MTRGNRLAKAVVMACIIVVLHGRPWDNNAACAIGDDTHCRSVGADCEGFMGGACASGCHEVQRIGWNSSKYLFFMGLRARSGGCLLWAALALHGAVAHKWWHGRNGSRQSTDRQRSFGQPVEAAASLERRWFFRSPICQTSVLTAAATQSLQLACCHDAAARSGAVLPAVPACGRWSRSAVPGSCKMPSEHPGRNRLQCAGDGFVSNSIFEFNSREFIEYRA